MPSGSPPSSPSRSPLALLSKLKRQLSKSPVSQHQKQPVEHQYLPIPTVSFSESLHSNRALSTYSCSNNSSSRSSFVLIDHNEEPGVDEYRPFLPLIIQHERQQQRLAPPRRAHRARILTPFPNDPPSPTSTASSKSPVTPIFTSSFFDEEDDDGIMNMNNSEVGSISEYSLPRSLSAYMDIHSRRSRKSGRQTSSDSESRHRSAGMTPPSRKSSPPTSPPPSCPLPEPPVSVKPMSDPESSSSHPPTRVRTRSLRNVLTAPVPALTHLSPAIPKTKAKTRPKSLATTILSDLEIIDSPTYASATTPTSDAPSDQRENDDHGPSPSTRTTTPTPRQYGMGRQVLSGSGSGRDFDFIGSSSKRLSASTKRDSTGMERKETRLSFGLESTLDSKPEQQLDKPSADEGCSEATQDPTQTQTQTQIPIPTPRRRVKSDDTNPNAGADVSRRTTHHEKHRHPEWTLFLGIPRNAAPPPHPSLLPMSTGEPNAIPDLASTIFSTAAPAMTQRHSFLTTPFLAPTMTMRSRTKSDSALLASASAAAPSGVEEHGDGKSKVDNKTKTNREDDWTLSLPLLVSPTTPSSAPSADVLRGSRHSGAPSGSGSQPVVEEECQPRVGEVDNQDLVITVEDVDKGKQKCRQVPVRRSEDQDPLILRVPRIVRSCSSYPLLSTTPTTTHGRIKKSSMGMGATSTPNLRRGISSCTLEEEVMFMLLGDAAAAEENDNESPSKSRSRSSSLSTITKKDLAQKKMATLDEDLARFNALLKNGNLSGTGSRPVSTIIESAVAAAAAATAMTKTKAVTLNSRPSTSPSPRKKSTSSQTLPILKPVLKHVKSCEPFLGSSDGGVVHPPSLPPSMGPVMRFPSSTKRGVVNFFDELGVGSGGGEPFYPRRASLRLTKSAEWDMGELGDDALMALGLPAPVPAMSASTSSRASSSPPPAQQQQQRTSRSNSPMTTSTTTQTPLLPFATKFTPSSSSNLNLKSKGSLGGFEMSGGRGGVPTPFRAVSMGSLSAPVESSSGFLTSQTEKQQQLHHQKRSPPVHLSRLHTPSVSSSSSSASSFISASSPQRHISISINNSTDTDIDTKDTPPPPPSPIPSESSSALATPLASAFPLPPSLPISGLDGVVTFQQKLREFENARGRQQQQQQLLQQQQQQRGQQRYQYYKPPSTASSFSSMISNASSTTTVVPSGDQKMKIRSVTATTVAGGSGQEREREGDVQEEEDENSMCSSAYYTARSSFSLERRSPGPGV